MICGELRSELRKRKEQAKEDVMSEHMFLLTKKRLTQAQAARIDMIVKDCGGLRFCGPVDLPGNNPTGWCVGPNLGSPFDIDLRQRVLLELEAQELAWLFV